MIEKHENNRKEAIEQQLHNNAKATLDLKFKLIELEFERKMSLAELQEIVESNLMIGDLIN